VARCKHRAALKLGRARTRPLNKQKAVSTSRRQRQKLRRRSVRAPAERATLAAAPLRAGDTPVWPEWHLPCI